MKSQLTLHRNYIVDAVDPRLFGGFIEHLGRAVYSGVYEPGHPSADEDGFRRDVLDLVRELRMPVMRYPGGNFVSGYNWEDGVGPREKRPARLDLAWRALEPNTFGVNEFVSWCRKADTAPMMAVNLGTRGIEEARNLLEYCNHPGGSHYSDLRREHGYPDPHNIRLWCLGNEMDGSWQMGMKTAHEYARIAEETAGIMRMLDPSLELVACGSSGVFQPWFGEYDLEVLKRCYERVDYLSAHTYYNNHGKDTAHFLSKPDEMDRQIKQLAAVADAAGAMRKSKKRIHISFDEYNVWYHSNDPENKRETEDWTVGKRIIEDVYNMEDVLVVGGMLITLLNNADRVKVACIAQTVNVIAPIMTEPNGPAWRQTIFYPFLHASTWGRGTALRAVVDCPSYDNADKAPASYLHAAAVVSPDGHDLTIFAVNRCGDEEMELEADLAAFGPMRVADYIAMRHDDLRASNTKENPNNVMPFKAGGAEMKNNRLRARLPKHSWNVLRLSAA